MSNTDAEKLAKDHWEWLESLLNKIFKDAFIHGYKHGYKDALEDSKPQG